MEYHTIRNILMQKGVMPEETDYAHSNQDMLDFRLITGDFYEMSGRKLRFKDSVDVMDFEQAAVAFPPFGKVSYKSREKLPYFTDGLDALREAMNRGESVAVEGGPCLFGNYEVSVALHLKGGRTRLFDYAGGKAYSQMERASDSEENTLSDGGFSETEELAPFLRENGPQVEQISFRQEKTGLTPQEYLNLLYPFEIAAALKGPLVITIPDMSYRKLLLAVMDFIPEGIREQALADYDAISTRIKDYYLTALQELRERYQIEQFLCIHGGDSEKLQTWYEKRAPFIERSRVLHSLKRKPERLESNKDYISMPALPYYLTNTNHILEVNSVYETDPYRKCKNAHRNDLQMGCILFPYLLSGDGVHTIYHAPLQWKEYGGYKEESS